MTIGSNIQQLLPDVLTDYLCNLIEAETTSLDAAMMECKLEPGWMGGRPIQMIELLGKQHLVYGFSPVQCKLLVLLVHGRYQLYLAREGR